MPRICLIHWHAEEGAARAARLRAMGYDVDFAVPDGPAFFRRARQAPPDVFLIDLTRLPSQGRDMAVALRQSAATRPVPLVFAGGESAKVRRIRDLLPDAVYAEWTAIGPAVEGALAHPPREPVVHASAMAGYSGTPLPRKLGIRENATVLLLHPPADFGLTLGTLPANVTLTEDPTVEPDLVIWFARDRRSLQADLDRAVALARRSPVWIAWPKKASTITSDLGQADVRAAGLAAGLVDYKICAIDGTWSGLLFTRRRD
jgi:CheY-like chemotaxis protein